MLNEYIEALLTEKTGEKAIASLKTLKEKLKHEPIPLCGMPQIFGILCTIIGESEDEKCRNEAAEAFEIYFKRPEFSKLSETLTQELMSLVRGAVGRFIPFRILQVGKIADKIRDFKGDAKDEDFKNLLEQIHSMKYPRFGTSGLRARMGIDFGESTARIVAQSICDHIKKENLNNKPVVIGYDSRIHADEVAGWVAEVCAANGIETILAERDTPSPALIYWAIEKIGEPNVAGVINCTPSHNPVRPEEWHGIRYSPPFGGPAPTTTTDWIGSRANQLQITGSEIPTLNLEKGKAQGKVRMFNPIEEYTDWLLSKLDVDVIRCYFHGKKVVDDEMHGASRGYLKRIFDKIGIPYEVVHGEKDPYLGELEYANPEEPYLTRCMEVVRNSGAALGFARDTDGDRFGVVDSGGVYFSANQIIAMLADYLITYKKYKGKVVRTLATSRAVDAVAGHPDNSKYVIKPNEKEVPPYLNHKFYELVVGQKEIMSGLPVHVVNVGFKYIAEVMQKSECFRYSIIIGGEESAGLTTKGHLPDKDGIWACLMVLEMVAAQKKSLNEIWQKFTDKYGEFHSSRKDVVASDEAKEQLINSYLDNPPEQIADLKVIYLGGVRYDLVETILEDEKTGKRSYLIIRASGTELLNRIYTESWSEEERRKIEKAVSDKLESLEKLFY
ncbi:hypothetical protein FJZ31_35305 [Candidatus Poribacteria bacterium]|nr:hypothetical protein [Candidatus Poribacteria bacterium]